MSTEFWDERGEPWEFDPGPPRNRKWPRLFAETPNYRAFGKEVTGREEFRWHFGPMFYRGRLGDGEVKVLIVGQEGAQDESLTHRSFSGGSGARMQNLLNHIGIPRSYLFMNTFVYPIFGQYDGDNRLIAQHPDSPVRRHREELFDYVVARNDLRLAIAVGSAAKESIASWIESHGGSADPAALELADASVISPGLHVLGVLHPGGAGLPGGVTRIRESFVEALVQIEGWAAADADWLPVDPDGHRESASAYTYSSDPIPFRDLPYGTAWRLGRGATSSNRKDDQQAIQLFGQHGKYNNDGHRPTYGDAGGDPDGYSDEPGDLPYEPPKREYRDFDRGPSATMARLLQGGQTGLPWPDFATFGLRADPSFGLGPGYRGRLEGASLLVIADQQSHDDLFTGRAVCGDAGQHLQAFLTAAGVSESYAVVRTLPCDTLDEDADAVRAAVDSAEVRALHAEIVRRARPEVLVLMGPMAARLEPHVNPHGAPTVRIRSFLQTGVEADWRSALTTLEGLPYQRDLPHPSYDYHGEREQIPRIDLPFGTLRWQATSGDRALRARRGANPSFDYYKYVMPDWAYALDPDPLSEAERRAAERLGEDQ